MVLECTYGVSIQSIQYPTTVYRKVLHHTSSPEGSITEACCKACGSVEHTITDIRRIGSLWVYRPSDIHSWRLIAYTARHPSSHSDLGQTTRNFIVISLILNPRSSSCLPQILTRAKSHHVLTTWLVVPSAHLHSRARYPAFFQPKPPPLESLDAAIGKRQSVTSRT